VHVNLGTALQRWVRLGHGCLQCCEGTLSVIVLDAKTEVIEASRLPRVRLVDAEETTIETEFAEIVALVSIGVSCGSAI